MVNMEGKALVSMSRKMYEAIGRRAEEELGASARDEMLRIIREETGFDPNASMYNEQKKRQIQNWRRRRAAETGLPVGAMSGGQKAMMVRKRAEARLGATEDATSA